MDSIEEHHSWFHYAPTDRTIDVSALTLPKKGKRKVALVLHGAGSASKERYLPFSYELASNGYDVIVYSAPGHGQSSGELSDSSLAERRDIALAICKSMGLKELDLVCGFSMGGYTAMEMLSRDVDIIVNKVVLGVPAAYAKSARKVKFGEGFTDIIRQPNSWHDSAAFEAVASFTGELATIETVKDTVIPLGVLDKIHACALKVRSSRRISLDVAPHAIIEWASKSGTRNSALAAAIATWDFTRLDSLELGISLDGQL